MDNSPDTVHEPSSFDDHTAADAGAERTVTIFGADWCADCIRSKHVLNRRGVPFTWIDLVAQPDRMADVMRYNEGALSIPVVVLPDGSHLTEPSDPALERRLRDLGLIPREEATR